MRINEKEAMYERPRVNMKAERSSFFTFMRHLLRHISSISKWKNKPTSTSLIHRQSKSNYV